MRRVSVVGCTGAGKSTLARALAARLEVPYVELDSVYHQANWTQLSTEEFCAHIAPAVDGDGWVIDGSYSAVRDVVWSRCDTVIWLDPPRRTVMRRVVLRSLRRVVTHRELWNGNRERVRTLLSRNPDLNIVLWAWRSHAMYRQRYQTAARDPAYAALRFVRVGSSREARDLLERS